MCMARGSVGEGEEWIRLGLGFTNPVGRVSVLRWCRWGVGRGLDQGLEGWCGVTST